MKLSNPLIIVIFTACFYSCNQSSKTQDGPIIDTANQQKEIVALLDSFNTSAANADYTTYFSLFDEAAIYTGTDATERWTKKQYMDWAKPYFDKKTTWNFTSIERHIYFDQTGNLAWFDELLNTQMKICRGSGVLIKKDNGWKVMQYILSTTVPNELVDSVTKMKAPIEDKIIEKLSEVVQ